MKEGCEVERTAHNSIHFEVKEAEFRLTLSGFDQRDVKVELRELQAEVDEDREGGAA